MRRWRSPTIISSLTGALFNLPAVAIVLLLTWLCYIGIRESSGANTAMVALKVALIIIVIIAGWHYVNPQLWHPFIPENAGEEKYGWSGIMRGATLVFFSYIGFEATSTAAQEAKNPQRDLADRHDRIARHLHHPLRRHGRRAHRACCRSISSARSEPVVTAVRAHPELGWLRWLVEIGALIGLSSVVLVHDHRAAAHLHDHGLRRHAAAGVREDPSEIPHAAHQHGDHRHRHRALAAIFPLDILGDLVSMGTLIAFVAVCLGVMILRKTAPDAPRTFRVPIAPVTCTLGVLSCLMLLYWENWYNWTLMIAWTVIGIAIYFGYGYRHSKLRSNHSRFHAEFPVASAWLVAASESHLPGGAACRSFDVAEHRGGKRNRRRAGR